MTTANEAAAAKTELAGGLAAGVQTLSLDQQITFTKYVRLVLPLDGFVFWIKADLLSPSAILNAAALNTFDPNDGPTEVTPAATLVLTGSLHYSTDKKQDESESFTMSRVVFTATAPVTEFRQIGPSVLYVAEFDGLQFAFARRGPFYQQADLYHYEGLALYSVMDGQLIDTIDGFDSTSLVVSNSLPLWLSLNSYAPPYYDGFRGGQFQLIPSFAIPQNLAPPYGAVHVDFAPGRVLQPTPTLDRTLSHDQLVVDRVRIVTYGLRNQQIMDFLDLVYQWSNDNDLIGLMNSPVPRDEKMTQVEMGVLAQKKSVEFEINYHQTAARNVARQLILKAVPTFNPAP